MTAKEKEKEFDFHKPEELEKYLDKRGRIKSRTKTGLTAKEQRRMERAVKRARVLALLPEDRHRKKEGSKDVRS